MSGQINPFLLSAILKHKRRMEAERDIEYFVEYYLGHFLDNKTPYFHKEIRQLLLKENRLAIAAPRGFAKSTNVQIIFALYCLLFHRGEDILTISMAAELAEDWIRKIKFELEGNERIKEDFGNILQWGESESKRWTANHLVIQQEGMVYSQIRARGRGCQVRGLRPTKVFADDLEDEELVRSDEQRKYLKEWFLGALLNVLKTDQQLVVIGTILHPLALLCDIIHKKDQFQAWTTKKYQAITDNKSLWEDRFPLEDLEKRKFEIGTYAFETEYQNNPITSDICLWKPDWIKTYTLAPKIKEVFAALDPASSEKESADYSAIVVMGIGEDNKIYELFSCKGQWGTWDLIDRVIQVNQKYKPIRFGVEEGVLHNILKPVLLKKTEENLSLRIPFERISLGKYTGMEKKRKQPRDKYTRALSVIHYWEQGVVFLKGQDLIDQISIFPTGSHDDLVDACVHCIRMIQKHSPVSIVMEKPKVELKGFEVKDNTIPCLEPIENIFKEGQKDWKIGQ